MVSKITTKVRNALPKSEFALPSERKYPVDTRARADNAKSRASQMERKGVISESMKETIDRKADKVLKKGKK